MKLEGSPRILIIRRDNIGDLVCTTPLLRALRRQLPKAWIAVLATRYNAGVLAGNPDLDAVYSYTKAKHRHAGESALGIYLRRLQTVWKLHRQRFDWILLPGGAQASSLRFARWIGAKRTLVRDTQDAVAGPHEVEQCCHLLTRMGLYYETPAARLAADPTLAGNIKTRLPEEWSRRKARVIALQLSARKQSQRWPVENFAALARRLHEELGAVFLLLWAPGRTDDPLHPGDDEKAAAAIAAMQGLPVHPVPTAHLEELIAALSLCDTTICSDGGAMHLAAALGKPMVCFFGHSGAERWRPWGVPHVWLQKPSRQAGDISVEETADAVLRLIKEIENKPTKDKFAPASPAD